MTVIVTAPPTGRPTSFPSTRPPPLDALPIRLLSIVIALVSYFASAYAMRPPSRMSLNVEPPP